MKSYVQSGATHNEYRRSGNKQLGPIGPQELRETNGV